MKKILLATGMVLLLSACSGQLPKCDSPDAVDLVNQIISDRSHRFGKYVSLKNVDETAYNKKNELRTCTAMLVTTKNQQEIYYSIFWENKDKKEKFYVEINY